MAKAKKEDCDKKVEKVKKGCKRKKTEKKAAFFVCKDCKKVTQDPETICKPKEIEAVFVCQKCGSRSVTDKSLCKPKPV